MLTASILGLTALEVDKLFGTQSDKLLKMDKLIKYFTKVWPLTTTYRLLGPWSAIGCSRSKSLIPFEGDLSIYHMIWLDLGINNF